MKHIVSTIVALLLCLAASAQDQYKWYKHIYSNDYGGFSFPVSPKLNSGSTFDMTFEYRFDMNNPYKGWAVQIRYDDRSYNYTGQVIDGSNLITADIAISDIIAGPIYRINILRQFCVALSACGGVGIYEYPTVSALSEQVKISRSIPIVRAECALEWYVDESFGLSLSTAYTQDLTPSVFSDDLQHAGYVGVNIGVVFVLF